jgi:hypothetical protein
MASAGGGVKVDAGSYNVLFGGLSPTAGTVTGQFRGARMSIDVALAPQNQAALNGLPAALYDPRSTEYRSWSCPARSRSALQGQGAHAGQ